MISADGTLDQLMVRAIAAETLTAARMVALWIGFGVPLLLAAPLAAVLLGMPMDVLVLLVPGLVAGALGLAALGVLAAAVTLGPGAGAGWSRCWWCRWRYRCCCSEAVRRSRGPWGLRLRRPCCWRPDALCGRGCIAGEPGITGASRCSADGAAAASCGAVGLQMVVLGPELTAMAAPDHLDPRPVCTRLMPWRTPCGRGLCDRAHALAAAFGAWVAGGGPGEGGVPGAGRLSAGRDRPHHVHPRAGGLAGDVAAIGHGDLGAGALVWRHPLADARGSAAAPWAPRSPSWPRHRLVWGKPMWGAWWVWDARLTSVLVLFFLYLGYIALVQRLRRRAARPARRGDPGAGRRRQPADHQVLGRVVEHAAPAGLHPVRAPHASRTCCTPLLSAAGGLLTPVRGARAGAHAGA